MPPEPIFSSRRKRLQRSVPITAPHLYAPGGGAPRLRLVRELEARARPVVDHEQLPGRGPRYVRRSEVLAAEGDVRRPEIADADEVDLFAPSRLGARLHGRDAALDQRADTDVPLPI